MRKRLLLKEIGVLRKCDPQGKSQVAKANYSGLIVGVPKHFPNLNPAFPVKSTQSSRGTNCTLGSNPPSFL